jgi:hypothetical protein
MTLGGGIGGNHGNGKPFEIGNAHASHPGELNGRYTHGARIGGKTTPEYHSYCNAKQRCTNPKNDRYADWGGRGIEFRFTDFSSFLVEVGLKPAKDYVLDRSDNNGHYEPGNVRWVTKEESARNKRRNGGPTIRDLKTGRFIC